MQTCKQILHLAESQACSQNTPSSLAELVLTMFFGFVTKLHQWCDTGTVQDINLTFFNAIRPLLRKKPNAIIKKKLSYFFEIMFNKKMS